MEARNEEAIILISDSDSEDINDTVTTNKLRRPSATRKRDLISDDDLLDLDDGSSGFRNRRLKEKKITRKNQIGRSKGSKAPKIKLPKLVPNQRLSPPSVTSTSGVGKNSRELGNERKLSSQGSGPDSPSRKSPKKKKTLADIVTDIHETSTDEIDSDEINASSEKLLNDPSPSAIAKAIYGASRKEEPQPCCSKSLLPQPSLRKNVMEPRKKRHQLISSDEELPDIEFEINRKFEKNSNTYTNYTSKSQKSQIPDYVRPVSQEYGSHSSTSESTSLSNSQVSNCNGLFPQLIRIKYSKL